MTLRVRDARYVYVNIDDSWEGDRDDEGSRWKTDIRPLHSLTGGESPMSFPIDITTLGINSGAAFTDAWQRKTTILQDGSEILVPTHGVTLLRGK